MRDFNYSLIKDLKWDSEIVSYLTAIHEAKGKQELYLKQQPEKLNKLVEIAKIQSTESSNDIEGIRTTNTRLKQLLTDKTTPKNRDEEEIAGYRDVLNVIHESFEYIPMTSNYILQLHKILYSHSSKSIGGKFKKRSKLYYFNRKRQGKYFVYAACALRNARCDRKDLQRV